MKLIIIFLLSLSPIAGYHRTSHHHSAVSIDDSIAFVTTPNDISTVKKLCKKFKGRPLFIDLWASWCEPCLDEFKFSADLTKWLKNEGITTLYVSFDNVENVTTWNKVIVQYNLAGYHMMANKNLRDDFSKVIWGAPGGYSLPHYLIVDKRGNIVEKNALNPSSADQIKRQILADLKLKQ